MGEGIRIGGGGGVRGVLKTYPTDFGVSRGDLCEIVDESFSADTNETYSTNIANNSLVSVLLSHDRIFYAVNDYDDPSVKLFLNIQEYGKEDATPINTRIAAIPIAAYLVNSSTIHLYTLNSTYKKVSVYSVDISGDSPILGDVILQFSSSNSSYLYFTNHPRFSQICSLGDNKYILFSLMGSDSGFSYGKGIQCTPIYDDGLNIIMGTPLWQTTSIPIPDALFGATKEKKQFSCCKSTDNSKSSAMLILVPNGTSTDENCTPTFLDFEFNNDELPTLTVTEIALSDTTTMATDNSYANNTYLLGLPDGTYGLILIGSKGIQIAHYSILENVATLIGNLTSISTKSSGGSAAAVGQKVVMITNNASASGSSNVSIDFRVYDMTNEPTSYKSDTLRLLRKTRLSDAYSIVNSATTAYRASIYTASGILYMYKAKGLKTVEKSSNAFYANKAALANTYGEFKVQE